MYSPEQAKALLLCHVRLVHKALCAVHAQSHYPPARWSMLLSVRHMQSDGQQHYISILRTHVTQIKTLTPGGFQAQLLSTAGSTWKAPSGLHINNLLEPEPCMRD